MQTRSYYYNQALNETRPAFDEAMSQVRANMADQGFTSSTAGIGQIAKTRGNYLAQAGQLANERANQDWQNTNSAWSNSINQGRVENQNRVDTLAALLSMRSMLGKKNLPKFSWPDFSRSYQIQRPQYIYGGPVGDPPETYIEPQRSYYGPTGDAYQDQMSRYVKNTTLDESNLDEQVRAARAREALQAEQNAIEQAKSDLAQKQFEWGKTHDQNGNPIDNSAWGKWLGVAKANLADVSDEPGMQRAMNPSDIVQMGMSDGVDVISMARDGDPKAIGILRALYPATSAKYPGSQDFITALMVSKGIGRASRFVAPAQQGSVSPSNTYTEGNDTNLGNMTNAYLTTRNEYWKETPQGKGLSAIGDTFDWLNAPQGTPFPYDSFIDYGKAKLPGAQAANYINSGTRFFKRLFR